MVNVSPKVVFGMLFFILSNVDVDFLDQELLEKTYTIKETFSIIKYVEYVGKKKFAAAALDLKHEIFVIHVASLNFILLDVYPFHRSQIFGFITKEALTKVFNEYVNFADIFFLDLASKFSKHTGINDYAIELVDGQQLFYGPIYSLGLVELETLKAYIKTNLANRFIKLFKSPAGAPILFNRKIDRSFRLCVKYRGLNNLTIKNRYLLPLVGESPDRLVRARWFI